MFGFSHWLAGETEGLAKSSDAGWGSTSLTILEVIRDAHQGEHSRVGAHSDARRNNSREALVRLGIQS